MCVCACVCSMFDQNVVTCNVSAFSVMQALCVVKLVNRYPEFCTFYSVTQFFFCFLFFFKYCQIGAYVSFTTAPQN